MSIGKPNIPYCRHCGEPITWHDTYGWFHGDFGGGWNTTCYDGDGIYRAEVNIEWGNQTILDLYDIDVPYPKVPGDKPEMRPITDEPVKPKTTLVDQIREVLIKEGCDCMGWQRKAEAISDMLIEKGWVAE